MRNRKDTDENITFAFILIAITCSVCIFFRLLNFGLNIIKLNTIELSVMIFVVSFIFFVPSMLFINTTIIKSIIALINLIRYRCRKAYEN